MSTLYIISTILIINYVVARTTTDDLGAKASTIVQTKYGKVKGLILPSRANRPYHSFKGIPFAKPPIGDLRFKAPAAPDSWNDILDAENDGPMCIQKNYLYHVHPDLEGQEDCLYLNVYTPKLPHENNNTLLPVMVYIHGGSYFALSGRSDYFGAEYFMDKDVVIVTFNYRVGVFGFLSTNDAAAPGNWGLKDQVAVFEWVRNNIANFGGDRKQVTIFGQSAGAGSVHLHLFSPTTEGLFHRAISQSGSVLSLWARPSNEIQAQVAKQQAQFVNCDPNTDTQTMIDCLRKVDAAVLANSADLFKYFANEPLGVYGPVTETKSQSNPEPYLLEDPLVLIQAGKFHKIPWVAGVVADEGILRASPLLRDSKTRIELNAHFNEYGPKMLSVAQSVPENEVASTWNQITDYFLQTDYVNISNPDSVQGFINLYTDRTFAYGAYQSALLHAWQGLNSVWFFQFDYKGEYTYGNTFAGTTENIDFNWGVCHTDDLLYLFTTSKYIKPLKSLRDILMSKIFIQMWTDYAIHGDPSPNYAGYQVQWDPIESLVGHETVKNADLSYLYITEADRHSIKFEIRNDFFTDRMLFWESLPLGENIKGIE